VAHRLHWCVSMSLTSMVLFLGLSHPLAATYLCHVTNAVNAVDGDESTWALNRKKNAWSVCQAAYVCPPGFVVRPDGACSPPFDLDIGVSSYMMVKNATVCDEFLYADVTVSRPQSCTGNRCATPVVTWVFGGHWTPGPNILHPGTWSWEIVDAIAVGPGDSFSTGYIEMEAGSWDGYDQVLLARDFDQPTGAYPDSRWDVDRLCSL
jgi:hypothetical protein